MYVSECGKLFLNYSYSYLPSPKRFCMRRSRFMKNAEQKEKMYEYAWTSCIKINKNPQRIPYALPILHLHTQLKQTIYIFKTRPGSTTSRHARNISSLRCPYLNTIKKIISDLCIYISPISYLLFTVPKIKWKTVPLVKSDFFKWPGH